MMIKRITVTAVCIALAISMAACGKSNNAPAPSNQPPANNGNAGNAGNAGNTGTVTANAENIYKQNCVSCHAVDLSGGVGPNLQHVGSKLSADQIHTQISNGGGGMPAFKGTLKDADITALTDWLSAQK